MDSSIAYLYVITACIEILVSKCYVIYLDTTYDVFKNINNRDGPYYGRLQSAYTQLRL